MIYTISNQIADQPFDNLQLKKIVKTDALEILSISLEKGATFPEHTSPKDAQLIVLEGEIAFHINETSYKLKTQQNFNFPKATPHFVMANENSKFLIIR
ncbi:cupin domain-containing protein [uncultured Eudoraea sp.]|uniref:cupin domain-containing protein n=1 Tax=uncultured Eudoraea sp. TaxID=1035614 RepID=UPI002625B929|nr:cupin domain-containing protein [uncultured Eudoraea sp.]